MIGNQKTHISKGQYCLCIDYTLTLTTAETWYKIDGEFSDGNIHLFEILDNKLYFRGADNSIFFLVGTSDLQVDKANTITYGLYKNGVLVENATTPHTFTAPSKTSNISISRVVSLNKNDYLEIYTKSDTDNIVISIHSLNIVLWGEK